MRNIDNIDNIGMMLSEFRKWNRDWDRYGKDLNEQPMSADEFINNMAKKYSVKFIENEKI